MFCALIQQVQLDASGYGEQGTLNQLMSWQESSSSTGGGILKLVVSLPGAFKSIGEILTFQPAKDILQGEWRWIYWIVFAPIIALVVYGMFMMFISIIRRNM
jgi:hypothetical protein